MGINDSTGAVLVLAFTPNGSRARLFRSDGPHTLPPLPGEVESFPGGLNDAEIAVGTSEPLARDFPSRMPHAVLWDTQDTPVALQPLVVNAEGWTLTDAVAIDNAGVIVGQGLFQGARHGFVLLPVLEAVAAVEAPPVLSDAGVVPPEEELPLPVVLATMDDEPTLVLAMRQHQRRHHKHR